MSKAQCLCRVKEFLVNRPDRYSTQPTRCQQTYINIPKALSVKVLMFNEVKDFMMFCRFRRRQFLKKRENFPSVCYVSAGEFTDDEGMTENFAVLKQGCERVY